jgi:hypothetical protein
MNFHPDHYLEQLNRCLIRGDILAFEKIMAKVKDDGILLDLSRIPGVEQKISDLIIGYLVSSYNIEEVLRMLQFANDYQLFANAPENRPTDLSAQTLELTIENLQSLFGDVSEGFLEFNINFLPERLSQVILDPAFLSGSLLHRFDDSIPLPRKVQFLYYLVNNYSYYGLRTRKVGTFREYIQRFQKEGAKYDEDFSSFEIDKSEISNSEDIPSMYFALFEARNEKHLIHEPLLTYVKQKYEEGAYFYEFPIISMVIYGGLGPEGKGFTYLIPPTGEIIEVCSDAKQSKAYVIEYKKYLKSIFLQKLKKHMDSWDISVELKNDTYNFFKDNIQTELVGFSDVEQLLEQHIYTYLEKIKTHVTPGFLEFLAKSIREILIPVQMEDQFKVRMDLITSNKLSETEIAKLASLGNISHYDILNQRIFFLNLVNNIVRILNEKKFI